MFMSEFDSLFSDKFFLIDTSDDLNNIETHLYGYLFDNNKIITNENIDEMNDLTPNGAYIYVENSGDYISISQDFHGSYGLYIYRTKTKCCISNSFLKLFEYIKDKYSFSVNYDYAKNSFVCYYSNFIYKETLINEIRSVSRYHTLKINKKTKEYTLIRNDYTEKDLEINSPEAISILDNWHDRWVLFIQSLKEQTDNISVDLSAGYDSRLVFGLVLNSCDLNFINVCSVNDDFHTHETDYELAMKVSERYNFKLNNINNFDLDITYFKELETSLLTSQYISFGTQNQVNYSPYYNNKTTYHFSGFYGENLRDYPHILSREDIINLVSDVSTDFEYSAKKVFEKNKKYLEEDFGTLYSADIPEGIFKEAIIGNHFGRLTVSRYLMGEISLNPLADYELYRIKRVNDECKDKDLLIALIFTRYFPDLLDYEFNDNEVINPETIDYAKKLNKKYPLKSKREVISVKKAQNRFITHNRPLDISRIHNYLNEIFSSTSFKKSFEKYFSGEVYSFMMNYRKAGFPLQFINPGLYFNYVMNIYEKNQINDFKSWLGYFTKIRPYNDTDYEDVIRKLLIYVTARIDLIISGNENEIEITNCDDNNIVFKEPSWLNPSEYNGIIIESTKTKLNLKMKCKKKGKLKVYLRGKDVRDKDKKRFPIYLEFTRFVINQEVIFDKKRLLSHDKCYTHELEVDENQVISLNVEWKPFDINCKYG